LLVALLVVALATVLIAALLDRGELTAARTRNGLRTTQAEAYALGLEAMQHACCCRTSPMASSTDTSGEYLGRAATADAVPGGRDHGDE